MLPICLREGEGDVEVSVAELLEVERDRENSDDGEEAFSLEGDRVSCSTGVCTSSRRSMGVSWKGSEISGRFGPYDGGLMYPTEKI